MTAALAPSFFPFERKKKVFLPFQRLKEEEKLFSFPLQLHKRKKSVYKRALLSPLAELASIHDENGEHLAFSTPETRTIIAYILLLLLEKEKKEKRWRSRG